MTMSAWVVVVASGKEEMLNEETCTAFLNLHNKPILSYSLSVLEHCPDVDGVVIVAPRDRLEQVVSVVQLFGCHKVRKIVPGAATEYASFVSGMKYVDEDAKIVVMHQASRPGFTAASLGEIIKATKRQGLVLLGQALSEQTAITGKTPVVEKFLDPGAVWTYGTPMAFTAEALKKIMTAIEKKKKNVKTVMEMMALMPVKPRLVHTAAFPRKINSIEVLQLMERRGVPV
jgi:2-C-methyl-D-erythritol 4-phosphate cytidylyltransferase